MTRLTNWIVAFVRCGLGRYSAVKPGLAALSRKERRNLYRLDRTTEVAFKAAEARHRDGVRAHPVERVAWIEITHNWYRTADASYDRCSGVQS